MVDQAAAWNAPISRGRQERRKPMSASGELSVDQAFEAFLRHQDYAETTRKMMWDYICGRRGRGWREANGGIALSDFTAERAVEFLDWYREDIGAMKETVRKVRNHLRRFAALGTLRADRGKLRPEGPSAPGEDHRQHP